MVAENLVQVQKNIEESCKKVNRDPGGYTYCRQQDKASGNASGGLCCRCTRFRRK